MKWLIPRISFLFIFSAACSNSSDQQGSLPETDIDAARNFIRSALDGDYDLGRSLLLSDSTNFQYYEEYEKAHRRLSEQEKKEYRNASINVHQVTPLNDSTTIFIYSNSYKQDHDTLRLIKVSDRWQVDLKYLFNHAMDTLGTSMLKNDSLP